MTIETYYCGEREKREQKKEEERLEKESETEFTHSADRGVYNDAPRVEVESSVDAYQNGEDFERVSKVWKEEERSQEEIKARIKDNEDYAQEKAAFSRFKKGCETKKTLIRAQAWCLRIGRSYDEKMISDKIKSVLKNESKTVMRE